MDALCRKVAASVEEHEFSTKVEQLSIERTKNNPEFSPLWLEKVISLVTATTEAQGLILLRYATQVLEIYLENLDTAVPDHLHSMLQLWFNQTWTFRHTKMLELQKHVIQMLLALCPIRSTFIETIVGAFVHQKSLDCDSTMARILIIYSKQHPASFYSTIEPFVQHSDANVDHIIGALFLIGVVLAQKQVQHARDLLSSGLWLSLLSLLKTSEDLVVLTIGTWILSLFVPQILRSLPDFLLDLLYIIKRALVLSKASPDSVLKKTKGTSQVEIDAQFAYKTSVMEIARKRMNNSSFSDHLRMSDPVGRIIRTPTRTTSHEFHDFPATWGRIRQIEIWYGSCRTGVEVITGIRITVQDVSGRRIQHPIRGEAAGTRQVVVLKRGEILICIDASCSLRQTAHTVAHPQPDHICALRLRTNFCVYPWIGRPSRQVELDLSVKSQAEPQSTGEPVLEELIGFHGVFEDGLRCIGGYFIPSKTAEVCDTEALVEDPASYLMRYVSCLFRRLYSIFPWHCLRFLHDECGNHQVGIPKQLITPLVQQLRIHPDIVESADQELLIPRWQNATPEELMVFVESLECDNGEVASSEPTNSLEHYDAMELILERTIKNEYRRGLRRMRSQAVTVEREHEETLWYQNELERQRKITKTLQEMVDRHRNQMNSFEKEQKKWQMELQLKISKFAHERQQLSEENIQLQELVAERDGEIQRLVQELDEQSNERLQIQCTLDIEREKGSQTRQLEEQLVLLSQEVAEWEHYHKSQLNLVLSRNLEEKDAAIGHLTDQLTSLENELEFWRRNAESQAENPEVSDVQDISKSSRVNTDHRILELEIAGKQKEQTNYTLKTMLERHQIVAEEKLNAVSDKYEHVKAANLALQKRAMQLMEELEREKRKNTH